jgi:hypothetical protein
LDAPATAAEPGPPATAGFAAPASEATRYLCAAVHLDRGVRGLPGTRLRKRIAENVEDNDVRALGLSPGVDLRPVIAQCHAARRRKLWRDLALAVLLACVLLAPASASPAVVVLCLALLAMGVVHVESWFATYRVVARRMLPGRFEAEREMQTDDPRVLARMGEIEDAQRGNVTVYSGFTPFVGVGFEHAAWSFAVNVAQGRSGIEGPVTPRPFAIADLYDHVTDRIRALAVPGLELEDRLYVDGRRVGRDPRFVPDFFGRPICGVEPAAIRELLGADGETARHYKVVRVVGWGGELVLSVYLRFLRVDRGLFVEASTFLLPPLGKDCHVVDGVHPEPGWRENLRLLGEAAASTPLLWVTAPLRVAEELRTPVRRWSAARRTRRQLRADPLYDRGAMASIRDLERSSAYRQYFQKLDREMYHKVIEGQLIDAIVEFLDDHDVDTSELRQRGATVLNNGVMVTGGTLQAGSVAAGSRAKAMWSGGHAAPAARKG